MASFQLGDINHVTLTASLVDKAGQLASGSAVANPPAWSVSDPSFLSLTPAADGMTCEARATGSALGTVKVTVTDGVLTGEFDIEVVPTPATGIIIVPSDPSEN